MDDKIYVHYGSNSFDPDKFEDPYYEDALRFKPYGGLWASEDTDREGYWSWKDWCEAERFQIGCLERSFRFKLNDNQKAFVIEDTSVVNTPYAFYQYPFEATTAFSRIWVDVEKLKEDGYTHVEFHENAKTHYPFWSWDCDCIFIIDPTVIQILEKGGD